MPTIFKERTGMILVLSMLIIAAVLAAATVFGNLIIREIQQSRLIDQSIQAYFIAESGAERALYQTRKREGVKPEECGEIVRDSSCREDYGYCCDQDNCAEVSCLTTSQGSLTAEVIGNWQVQVNNEPETSVVMEKGGTFQIDLFSPFQVKNANIAGIRIEELDSSQPDPLDPDKTVPTDITLYWEFTNLTNILKIAGNDVVNCRNQQPVFKDFNPQLTAKTNFISYITALGQNNQIFKECSYIFRVSHPLNSGVDWVKLKLAAFNDMSFNPDAQVNIPSRLIIESSAIYGNSLQRITVKTSTRPPLSGLYDFVLFAEEKVIKE